MKMKRLVSFKYRIVASSLLVALVPLALCSVLMVQIFISTLERQKAEQSSRTADELYVQFTQTLTENREALNALANNKLVQQALVDHGSDALSMEVYLTVYQATNGVRSGAAFALYDAGGQLQFSTQDNAMEAKLPVRWGLLRLSVQNPNYAATARDETIIFSPDAVCLQLAQPINTPQGIRVGYAVCGVTARQLDKVFSSISGDNLLLLFNAQGRLFYSSHADSTISDTAGMLRRALLTDTSADGNGYAFSSRQDSGSGMILVLRSSSAITTSSVRLMQTISLISAVVCMVLCVLLSLKLSRSLTFPLSRMAAAMQQVRGGDLSVRIPQDRPDELGQLAGAFNDMTRQLGTYVDEQVQRQKDLNDAQIRQLQAQLNPHFLYNTLDTMKWLAKIHQLPEVASLAANLAGILRSSIASEQFITLRRELELAERYIAIQKIRFSDKFEYSVQVPESLQGCIVPKLILQPLVENAIVHGLDGAGSGNIRISGRQEGELLIISVADSGCGMPAEMVERLNSPQPKLLDGHLGLYNVSRILQLYYGDGYGLHAESRPGGGTTVTVRIPAKREENNAESRNR